MKRPKLLRLMTSVTLFFISTQLLAGSDRRDTPEAILQMIQTSYLEMYQNPKLSPSERKLGTEFYAEKVAALGNEAFNTVIFELSWMFESRPETRTPLTLLFREVEPFTQDGARLSENENILLQMMDYALLAWFAASAAHGSFSGYKRMATLKDLTFSTRMKGALFTGSGTFYQTLFLQKRAKWAFLGVTSATDLAIAYRHFFQEKKLKPLSRLENSSRKVMALIQIDLQRSKIFWKNVLSESMNKENQCQAKSQTMAPVTDLPGDQIQALKWLEEVHVLSKLSVLFLNRTRIDGESDFGLSFMNEHDALEVALWDYVQFLQNANILSRLQN